jgi:hypothetical protein
MTPVRSRLCVLLATVAAFVVAASAANASQIISTTSVSHLTLGVNARGEGMLTYTVHGRMVHVLAWGAVNAIAPTTTGTQLAFKLAYDGGFQKHYTDNPAVEAALKTLRLTQGQERLEMGVNDRNTNRQRYAMGHRIAGIYATLARLRSAAETYWQTFTCPTYNGPAVADLVAACTAPDGSYWAVQSWDRDLPDYGLNPTQAQAQIEIHLSHWTGALPVLTVHTDWAYGGQWNHLWGTYTYDGQGVYGFHSTRQGAPLDSFGRNLYVDTYDSVYGPGWRRENSFLTHDPGGSWCYSVNPHGSHPAGTGSQYRLTILGPGVTPDVSLTVAAPGPYDRTAQGSDRTALSALGDPACVPH